MPRSESGRAACRRAPAPRSSPRRDQRSGRNLPLVRRQRQDAREAELRRRCARRRCERREARAASSTVGGWWCARVRVGPARVRGAACRARGHLLLREVGDGGAVLVALAHDVEAAGRRRSTASCGRGTAWRAGRGSRQYVRHLTPSHSKTEISPDGRSRCPAGAARRRSPPSASGTVSARRASGRSGGRTRKSRACRTPSTPWGTARSTTFASPTCRAPPC